MHHVRISSFLFALSTAATLSAHAATVVRIVDKDVFVDVGKLAGARPGTLLQVSRAIRAKHPDTGALLVDYFPLGTMRIDAAGEVLSLAHEVGGASSQAKVGDRVEWQAETPPDDATGRAAPSEAELAKVRALEAAVGTFTKTWAAALKLDPAGRAAIWKSFLELNPQGPFEDAVRAELDASRVRETERKVISESAKTLTWRAPSHAYTTDPVELVVLDDGLKRVRASFRALGADSYASLDGVKDGGAYRIRIPAAALAAPELRFFLQARTTDGTLLEAGSAETPLHLTVEDPPLLAAPNDRGRTALHVGLEFTDLDNFRGTDRLFVGELDVAYRLHHPIVDAVRLGFGSLNGVGSLRQDRCSNRIPECKTSEALISASDLKATGKLRDVAYNFGYAGVSLNAGEWVGLEPRFIVGSGLDGVGVGIEGRVRVGHADGTHLVVGGNVINDVGYRGLVEVGWAPGADWRMSGSVAATNQPQATKAIGELGVRIGFDAGWRATDWLTLNGSLIYGGRDIAHTGAGAGLGATFEW